MAATLIGPYELISELGSGAMGKVYRARDTRLDREVALKVLWPHLAEHDSYIKRFKREAQAAAAIDHPNVIRVFDVGDTDGKYYIAMEFVSGNSLLQLLGQPLAAATCLDYFKQIIAGLSTAHAYGIIHRDLKPGNILIDKRKNCLKLADFGLARVSDEQSMLTMSGEMLGTIEYMAPELAHGVEANISTDLYAAGVILYRMLTGRLPFAGPSPVAIIKAHDSGCYTRPSEIIAGCPPQAEAIITKLLAKNPLERYSDCQMVVDDLARWEKGEDVLLGVLASYQAIDTGLGPKRLSRWQRLRNQVTSWFRYQYLEIFDRTERTAIHIQDAVSAQEQELSEARRRVEDAIILHERLLQRQQDNQNSITELERQAETAMQQEDEPRAREILAKKVALNEQGPTLVTEIEEGEKLVSTARKKYDLLANKIAELRHRADLLLSKRRRAKLELSIIGVLPERGRRGGERLLALGKLLAVPVLCIAVGLGVASIFFSSEPEVAAPAATVAATEPDANIAIEEIEVDRNSPERRTVDEQRYVAYFRDEEYEPIETYAAEQLGNRLDPFGRFNLARLSYILSLADLDTRHYDNWVNASPSSYLPYLVRARHYIHRAWQERGSNQTRPANDAREVRFRQFLTLANKDLAEAYQLNPNDPNIGAAQINTAVGLGRGSAAVEAAFQRALAADPYHSEAYINRAWSLQPRWGGNYDELFAFARDAAGLIEFNHEMMSPLLDAHEYKSNHPEHITGYYSQNGVWNELETLFEKAIQYHPDNFLVHANYARWAYKAGRIETARREYDKAMDIYINDYNNQPITEDIVGHHLRRCAWFFAENCISRDDAKKALRYALEAYEIHQTGEFAATVGAAYSEVGDFEEAIRFTREALRKAASDNYKERLRNRIELFEAGTPLHEH